MSVAFDEKMLGLAIVALCGLFLYYYRPRNLETKFRQPLLWSEVGKGCFVCQVIFLLLFQCVYLIVWIFTGHVIFERWMEFNNMLLYPFTFLNDMDLHNAMLSILFYGIPIISAMLTQWKIIGPLREEKAPRHHLYLLVGLLPVMSVVVLFFDFFFGFFPDMMRLEMMLPLFLPSLAFFSPVFIAVFAVEMSLSKLVNYEVDNENPISVTLP